MLHDVVEQFFDTFVGSEKNAAAQPDPERSRHQAAEKLLHTALRCEFWKNDTQKQRENDQYMCVIE